MGAPEGGWSMRRLSVVLMVLALSAGPGATLAAEEQPPSTDSFSPAGSLAEAREGHSATLLPDGRVLVVGGSGKKDSRLVSAEVWDPARASFDPAGSVAEARYEATATLLRDGRVLVVGTDRRPAAVSSSGMSTGGLTS
jgi:hypothetical protein